MDSNPCAAKILAAVNRVFSCSITENVIICGESGLHGGAWNIVLDVRFPDESAATVRTFNAILPGRDRKSVV